MVLRVAFPCLPPAAAFAWLLGTGLAMVHTRRHHRSLAVQEGHRLAQLVGQVGQVLGHHGQGLLSRLPLRCQRGGQIPLLEEGLQDPVGRQNHGHGLGLDGQVPDVAPDQREPAGRTAAAQTGPGPGEGMGSELVAVLAVVREGPKRKVAPEPEAAELGLGAAAEVAGEQSLRDPGAARGRGGYLDPADYLLRRLRAPRLVPVDGSPPRNRPPGWRTRLSCTARRGGR